MSKNFETIEKILKLTFPNSNILNLQSLVWITSIYLEPSYLDLHKAKKKRWLLVKKTLVEMQISKGFGD